MIKQLGISVTDWAFITSYAGSSQRTAELHFVCWYRWLRSIESSNHDHSMPLYLAIFYDSVIQYVHFMFLKHQAEVIRLQYLAYGMQMWKFSVCLI